MKKTIAKCMLGAFAGLCLWGCTNDSREEIDPGIPEEDVMVKVTFKLSNAITRAAGGNWEGAEDAEKAIPDGLSILVFNSKNTLEDTHDITGPITDGQEETIKVKTGLKYFYVVANQDFVTTPPGLMKITSRKGFETQLLAATISAVPSEILSITTPDFVIGTLWGKPVTVSKQDPPMELPLDIGRAAAKVKLHNVVKGTNSNMAGDFEDPYYRLGSVPNIYYHVGQYDDSGANPIMPPLANHGSVTSAVHNEGWGTTGTPNMQNNKFGNYSGFVSVTALASPLTDCFYAVENTTALDNGGLQYYGNTTYVQLRTKYVPHEDEVVDINTLEKTALTGETFYVVTINNRDYIVPDLAGKDPEDVNARMYEDGLNYHKFPIKDVSETDPERMHAVLRNHYYEIDVRSIKNLGEPSGEVDPSEPIAETVDVDVTINILDWSKISQSEDL